MMVYVRHVVSKRLRASHRWPKIAKLINLPVGAQTRGSTLLAECRPFCDRRTKTDNVILALNRPIIPKNNQ